MHSSLANRMNRTRLFKVPRTLWGPLKSHAVLLVIHIIGTLLCCFAGFPGALKVPAAVSSVADNESISGFSCLADDVIDSVAEPTRYKISTLYTGVVGICLWGIVGTAVTLVKLAKVLRGLQVAHSAHAELISAAKPTAQEMSLAVTSDNSETKRIDATTRQFTAVLRSFTMLLAAAITTSAQAFQWAPDICINTSASTVVVMPGGVSNGGIFRPTRMVMVSARIAARRPRARLGLLCTLLALTSLVIWRMYGGRIRFSHAAHMPHAHVCRCSTSPPRRCTPST